MTLDFKVSHLKAKPLTTKNNSHLIHFVKKQQRAMGLTNLQLIKRMGFSNTNKALRRLQHFEQTGQLPNTYRQKIGEILGFESADIKRLESQHLNHQFADLQLFISHFDHIWLHRKMIIHHRDYANITFEGIYLSVAYLGAPEYNIGMLLQHYINGDWICDGLCCDQVYVIGAGGSPLSGRNSCHGFCIGCRNQRSFKLSSFGTILKAHKKLKVASEQRQTDKTLADLLRAFPRKPVY